jgi:hypothetical protein
VAQNECSSSEDCEAGVCEDGACVNPDTCTENSDCVQRTFCAENGTCEPDPCVNTVCERGVCQRGTDNCVSASSCTQETEEEDCVAGEKCADGTCQPEESFCENVSCDRGVCRFSEGGCANAMDCAGDDANCVEGFFCSDTMNRCRANLCVQNDITCPNGVCDPATGRCENATTCTSNEDCLEDHLCVQASGEEDGTCRLEATACGDASGDGGCPGNQTCEYDAEDLSATCQEPEDCTTSLDCKDARQCAGRSCMEPVSCSADIWESNDSASEATVLTDGNPTARVEASLCQGDTDYYTFDSRDLGDVTTSATLIIQLDVADRDVGLGRVDLELTKDGSVVAEGTTGARGTESSIRIQEQIGATDQGDFNLAVTTNDQIKQPGVSYDLAVSMVPGDTVSACETATPLRANQRVSGNTTNSSSSALTGSCITDGAQRNEDVYMLEIDDPQEIQFELTPQISSANLGISIREQCTQAGTERACQVVPEAGEPTTQSALLGPGTYFVTVHTAAEGAGGPYTLNVSTTFTACAEDTAFCSGSDTAQLCSQEGGRFRSISCDAGCDPTTGRCVPPAGQRCGDAPQITRPSDNPGESVNRELNLAQYTNAYEVPSDSCLSDTEQSTGPEKAYQVVLPAKTSIEATASFQNEVDGSLYLVNDCSSLGDTCLAGASGSTDDESEETLNYSNTTENEQTAYLVVDSRTEQSFSTVQLSVTYTDVICTPDARRCSSAGNVEQCNDLGTAFNQIDNCRDWGCSGGTCQRPNNCSSVRNLTSQASQDGGVTFTGEHTKFTNDFSVSENTCGELGGIDTEGPDAVFSVDLADGEGLRVSSSSTEDDMNIAVESSCGAYTTQCLAWAEGFGDGPTVEYASDSNQTVYVLLDLSESSPDQGETFSFTAEIVGETCTPESVTCDGATVEYCPSSGLPDTYTCASGCTNGTCDTTNSEFCYDAEDITSQANGSGGLTRTIDWTNFSDDYDWEPFCDSGSVDQDEIAGQDATYKLDLAADEYLTANLDTTGSSDDASLMVLNGCTGIHDQTACNAGSHGSSQTSVTYSPDQAETVYLVAANDNGSGSNDSFELDAEIKPKACTPETRSCSGGSVNYCGTQGISEFTYSCPPNNNGDDCSNGMCGIRNNEFCYTAENITTQAKSSGGFSRTGSWGNFSNDIDDDGAWECLFLISGDSSGEDVVYRVDLQAGETLDASMSSSGTKGYLSAVTLCNDYANSCVTGDLKFSSDSSANINFTAQQDRTLFIIADNAENFGHGSSFTINASIN